MPSLTFKLHSSNYVGTIDMEGQIISCAMAREAIAAKIHAPVEEVHVFMSGSTALIHPDEGIPAYSVLSVERHVATERERAMFTRGRGRGAAAAAAAAAASAAAAAAAVSASLSGELGGSPSQELTEDERLALMQAKVNADSGMGSGRGRGGYRGRGGGLSAPPVDRLNEANFQAPRADYICNICGRGGHQIWHCPLGRGGRGRGMGGDRGGRVLALPVGIPESALVECTMDDPGPKFITADKRLVTRRIDSAALGEISLLVGGAANKAADGDEDDADNDAHDGSGALREADGDNPAGVGEDTSELRCAYDGVLAKNAMRFPCCGALACETCLERETERYFKRLDDGEDEAFTCPKCKEAVMLDDIAPGEDERKKIEEVRKSRKRPRS